MTVREFSIGPSTIGEGYPCYIIAEIGVNHNGDIDLARRTIDAAAGAGANAVKFQTFQADKLVTRSAPKAQYQIENTGSDDGQYTMLKALELSFDDHAALKAHCADSGIGFLSSPFHLEAVDLLASLGVDAFKIPSGEITNLAYLAYIAAKGRPMILSTGMADMVEVGQALQTIEAAGAPPVVILHCLSNYPADPSEANLRAMTSIDAAFGHLVGYSDHTIGAAISIAAVALGARMIEKHITFDRTLPGPDHNASIEPAEFAAMISGIRAVEQAMGDGVKRPMPSELSTRDVARKSLCAAQDIAAGTVLRDEDIVPLRPGTGMAPSMAPFLVGRRIEKTIQRGTVFELGMFEHSA